MTALEGQKTGAFLDQRENYAAAAHYAHGEALDIFCYQGGFALHLRRKMSHRHRRRQFPSRARNGREERRPKRPASERKRDRMDRGQRLRPAPRLRGRRPPLRHLSSSIRPPSPKPSATSTKPAAATRNSTCAPLKMLAPGRNPRHLLVFVPRERRGLPRSRRRCRP